MKNKTILLLVAVSLWCSTSIFAQPSIGLFTGIHFETGQYFNELPAQSIVFTPQFARGHQLGLFYQTKNVKGLQWRGQLYFSTMRQDFKVGFEGNVFTSSMEANMTTAEFNLSLLPMICLRSTSKFLFGLGLNYYQHIVDQDLLVVQRNFDFQTNETVTMQFTAKQRDFFKLNGVGLILNIEHNFELKPDLDLLTGFNFHHRLTSFTKSTTAFENVYTLRFGLHLGLVKQFL